jgi:hypothetical protein
MRTTTDFIVVHCSATRAKMDIGAKEIKEWHTLPPPKGNGWSDIGYHFVIRRDGTEEIGRAIDKVGSHVAGYNSVSIGVCLVGGMGEDGKGEDNFTEEQRERLLGRLVLLRGYAPKAIIQGHRDFPYVRKECPSFDVRRWLAVVAPELLIT